MARTMLIDAHMPETFWHDAILTTVYFINRLPTATLHGLCPFSKLFSKPPDYSFLHVFVINVFLT